MEGDVEVTKTTSYRTKTVEVTRISKDGSKVSRITRQESFSQTWDKHEVPEYMRQRVSTHC